MYGENWQNLFLIDSRWQVVEARLSPARGNEDLSSELFLSRADVTELHERHVDKHLPPLSEVIHYVVPRNNKKSELMIMRRATASV